jgi:hypothetical protein
MPRKTSKIRDRGRLAVARTDLALVFRALFDSYRPERHYMRGPGPKWLAKYGHPCARA